MLRASKSSRVAGHAITTRSRTLAAAASDNSLPTPTIGTSNGPATEVSTLLGKRSFDQAAGPVKCATKKPKAASRGVEGNSGEVDGDGTLDLVGNDDEKSASGAGSLEPDSPAGDDQRPPPQGMPPVWAKTRGDLAETLDFFRSRQGGIQTNDGFIRGLLIAHDASKRPYIDGEVILTRAGGGNETVGGRTSQAKDHKAEGVAVMSFKNNMRYEVPAVVILSDRCLHTFTKPPHPYSVMDHFKPIYLWYEKNLGHLTARFRWERLNLDGKAWWASQDCPTRSGPPDYNTKAERQVCPSCHQTHPRIYQEGFICVNHKCSDFWKLNGEVIASKATLTYSHVWLEERTEWSSPVRPPFALRPKALPMDDAQDPFYTTMRAAMKGIVCPQCGSCIPRKRMDGWFCNTTNCGYVCRLPRMNLNIRSVELAYGSQFQGHPIPYHVFSDPISRRRTTYHGPWRIETFGVLEGCFVKHFHSNELINARPGGANDMFKQMSDPALGLERRPMGASKVNDTLTGHFAHNFGLKYKYSAAVPTMPFSEAPAVIIEALNKMSWVNETAQEGDAVKPLNEALSLGYFEEQAIHWHDDGEKFLGPTIVTFSLGCMAKMEIRMKGKYYYGTTSQTLQTYDPKQPIIDGCLLPEMRQHLNDSWEKWSEVERKEQLAAFKKLGKRAKSGPVIFHTRLRHGDFAVMHGNGLQKYFEHQISNLGDVRFAITGRHVRPETRPTEELAWGEWSVPDDLKYTGDMDAFNEEVEDPTAIDPLNNN